MSVPLTLATSASPEASTNGGYGVYFDVRSDGPGLALTALSGGGYDGSAEGYGAARPPPKIRAFVASEN